MEISISMENVIKRVKSVKLLNVKLLNQLNVLELWNAKAALCQNSFDTTV